MLLVRPLDFGDIQALEQLALQSGGRMTTLPADRDHLSQIIGTTRQSLRKKVHRAGTESYHFALEKDGRVIGVAGIDATVGIGSPFYSYRISEVVHASAELQIHNRVPALHLCQDYAGCSRLCTLFIDPAHRTPRTLHLLSRARMLFMAAFPERFAGRTVVELQGVLDAEGRSPFWEALGRHFFNMDFDRANYLTGINSKGFIADLMPQHPVYVPLLPQSAQEVIGEPRPDVEDVMALLEDEGFCYRGYVDIFDAGPTLEARTDQIRTLCTSRELQIEQGSPGTGRRWMLVSNGLLQDFRCVLAELDDDNPALPADTLAALAVDPGAGVRVAPVSKDDLEAQS